MIQPSATALAMLESIAIEDDCLAAAAEQTRAIAGASVSTWLDPSMAEPLAGTPLLAFETERRGRVERVAVHVGHASGLIEIATARSGPDGWARYSDTRIHGADMTPLIVTLSHAAGPDVARTVALGSRIANAARAAM